MVDIYYREDLNAIILEATNFFHWLHLLKHRGKSFQQFCEL